MKKAGALIVLCLVVMEFITAGNHPDSLFLQLNDARDDSARVVILLDISDHYKPHSARKALMYAQKALSISEKSTYRHGIFNACMTIGTNYYHRNLYPKAAAYFFRALKIAEARNDKARIAYISNLLGAINNIQGNLNQSLKYHYRSIKLYFELKDKNGLAETYTDIGKVYKKQGNNERALNIFNKAISLNRKLNHQKQLAHNYGNVGSVMLDNHNRESRSYFERQQTIAQSINDTVNLACSHFYMGEYHQQYGTLEAARGHYQKSLELMQPLQKYEWLYRINAGISKVYAQSGAFELAYAYLKDSEQYSDSLQKQRTAKTLTREEMQREFTKLQERREASYSKQSRLYMVSGWLLLVILTLSVIYFFQLRRKIRTFNSEKAKMQETIDNLRNQLEKKKKELTTQTMYKVKKEEALKNIKTRILKSKLHIKHQNHHMIDRVINDLNNCLSDETWQEFEKRFEDVHTGFYKKINQRFPQLTSNEKKLCAFLKMEMTTKEIAQITQQSPNSIEVARTRLRKKLNLCNTDITLSAFLSQL